MDRLANHLIGIKFTTGKEKNMAISVLSVLPYVSVYVCVHKHECEWQRLKLGVFSVIFRDLIFRQTGSPTEPGTCSLSLTDWPAHPKDLPLSVSPVLGLLVFTTLPANFFFLCGLEGFNLGSHPGQAYPYTVSPASNNLSNCLNPCIFYQVGYLQS